jgi:hypothetical protein
MVIGSFIPDALLAHRHRLTWWNANKQTGDNFVARGEAYVSGTIVEPDNLFIEAADGAPENRVASISVFVCLTY